MKILAQTYPLVIKMVEHDEDRYLVIGWYEDPGPGRASSRMRPVVIYLPPGDGTKGRFQGASFELPDVAWVVEDYS